ncbi:MAG: helix-turn-helix domain-containing protein [Planctomycetia bacterium]|nr:helix-turn-helix domain-containing protein [Planctomycetia bacterium]
MTLDPMSNSNDVPSAEELVTPKEAARLLKDRNLKTIYRLILKGRLPAWKIVGRLYVRRDDVLAFIEPVEPKLQPAAQPETVSKQQKKEIEKWRAEVRKRSRLYPGPTPTT